MNNMAATSTQDCKFWKQGCRRPNCTYNHPKGEGNFKTITGCWYNFIGKCKFGQHCRHNHEEVSIPRGSTQQQERTACKLAHLKKHIKVIPKLIRKIQQLDEQLTRLIPLVRKLNDATLKEDA